VEPSNEEEPEAASIAGPPDASQPKKEPKDMIKKELIAYCTTLIKKVARKQLSIHDLKKKKGVANTACEECKVITERYEDKLQRCNANYLEYKDEHISDYRKLVEENTKLTEDIKKLKDENVEIKHDAAIEKVKMEGVSKTLTDARDEVKFYKSRLFPDHTPAHGANHAASISMAGGGGNRGASPAAFIMSPPM